MYICMYVCMYVCMSAAGKVYICGVCCMHELLARSLVSRYIKHTHVEVFRSLLSLNYNDYQVT